MENAEELKNQAVEEILPIAIELFEKCGCSYEDATLQAVNIILDEPYYNGAEIEFYWRCMVLDEVEHRLKEIMWEIT